MNTWINIAIDIGVLAFAGLLYYIYQRRRILRHSLFQIEDALDKFHYHTNEYAEEMMKTPEYDNINSICEILDDYFQNKNLEQVLKISEKISYLPNPLQEEYKQIADKILDHLKVS
jgi:hypothetical protein